MTDKIPNDAALRSRVADLLHLLQFARIETPAAGDAEQAEKAMNDLERMLAQQPAPAVPMGWKLVPVESSIEMEDAGRKAASRLMGLSEANRVYRAMLAAAPAAPVAVQPLPYWTPCNPACDPELNGSRSKLCDCAQATAALAAPPAAEQPDTVAVPRELYTCIGKGGRYELLGESSGAGGCRREGRVIYRCLDTGQIYHRTDDDFAARAAIAKARGGAE